MDHPSLVDTARHVLVAQLAQHALHAVRIAMQLARTDIDDSMGINDVLATWAGTTSRTCELLGEALISHALPTHELESIIHAAEADIARHTAHLASRAESPPRGAD